MTTWKISLVSICFVVTIWIASAPHSSYIAELLQSAVWRSYLPNFGGFNYFSPTPSYHWIPAFVGLFAGALIHLILLSRGRVNLVSLTLWALAWFIGVYGYGHFSIGNTARILREYDSKKISELQQTNPPTSPKFKIPITVTYEGKRGPKGYASMVDPKMGPNPTVLAGWTALVGLVALCITEWKRRRQGPRQLQE
jgi:hypothetical protein